MIHRRRTDLWSYACLAWAFVLWSCGVVRAYQTAQETINALTDYKMVQINQRLDRLETGALWLAGALIANLGAHALQIRGEVQRRRQENLD